MLWLWYRVNSGDSIPGSGIKGISFFATVSRPTLRPNEPPIQRVPGAFFLVVQRPGREADHSPPPDAEVKNSWTYITSSLYVFMACYLVKHRDNLIFTTGLYKYSTKYVFHTLSYPFSNSINST
jgi:hypothetical protein